MIDRTGPRYTRYAIYFAPNRGALASLGASWLGWDLWDGVEGAHPDMDGLPALVADITATPRKYGFHATLKPPFRLKNGTTEEALRADMAELANAFAPVTLEGLRVACLGKFVALTPMGDTGALNALAARCVRDLDPYRALAPDDEIAKRRARGLTPAQDAMLLRWGYPYVLDEFRFHMTLSGKLGEAQSQAVTDAIGLVFADVLPAPFVIDAITLCGEGNDGRFRAIKRYPLTGELKKL